VETLVTLCVLLWARDGCADALVAYEDRVLPFVVEHGGRVLERARTRVRTSSTEPLEIQLLSFPSEHALDDYMSDARRAALAPEREVAIARTEVLRVDLV
jgi:uncharacterized protein (DUF1330 family)